MTEEILEYKNTLHIPQDDDIVRNPLNNYPVNSKCPCESDKKYKKCCRPSMVIGINRRVTREEAGIYQEFVDGMINGR